MRNFGQKVIFTVLKALKTLHIMQFIDFNRLGRQEVLVYIKFFCKNLSICINQPIFSLFLFTSAYILAEIGYQVRRRLVYVDNYYNVVTFENLFLLFVNLLRLSFVIYNFFPITKMEMLRRKLSNKIIL